MSRMYGSEHITYGAKKCPGCGQIHPANLQIKETSQSRFKLLQFAAEMTAYDMSGRNRKAVADAFMKARSEGGKEFAKLNKDTKEVQRAIDNVDKAKFLEQNQAKLLGLQQKFDALDKKLTSGLRGKEGLERSFQSKFPDGQDWYSPSYAASLRGENVKFMLGILISDKNVLITTSGSGLDTEPFKATAALKGYEICKEVLATDAHKSIVGRGISALEYGGTQGGQGYVPGNCAAPRLLARAFEMPEVMKTQKAWEMSEMYYFPNNDARRKHEEESDKARLAHVELAHKGQKGNVNCVECQKFDSNPVGSLYWVPGLSAHSCETCENLVPLLMCPKKV